MKKILLFTLVFVLALSIFTGCGSDPDLTGVIEKLNEISTVYDEADVLFEANGWYMDDKSVETHKGIADMIVDIRESIENPELSKNIDVEDVMVSLEEMLIYSKEYKEAVSVRYPYLIELTILEEKVNELIVLYPKAYEATKAAGWHEDDEYLDSLNEIFDAIEESRILIDDPSVIENSGMIQVEIDARVELLEVANTVLNDSMKSILATNYFITENSYSEKDNLAEMVKKEFGAQATIADWFDIKKDFDGSIELFIEFVELERGEDKSVFVTNVGEEFGIDNRHYFITRFDGSVKSGFLVHDQIQENTIVLGSWLDKNHKILVKLNK